MMVHVHLLLISLIVVVISFKGFDNLAIKVLRRPSQLTKLGLSDEWQSYIHQFPDITSSQFETLERLSSHLREWNGKVNLISRKDIDQLISSHIVPCMSISLAHRFKMGDRVIDVGTGGGLPGELMSLSLYFLPAIRMKRLVNHYSFSPSLFSQGYPWLYAILKLNLLYWTQMARKCK